MSTKTPIGLAPTQSPELATKLNALLANYQLHLNGRGFHWNSKGETFFARPAKFEASYSDALGKSAKLRSAYSR